MVPGIVAPDLPRVKRIQAISMAQADASIAVQEQGG
jgi:hypothetical protein